MNQQKKKFNLKIPQDLLVIFSHGKRTLTVVGPVTTKSIKLKLKIIINKTNQTLSVSPVQLCHMSNAEKKKINVLRASTIAQIKHLFVETSTTIFQKLKMVGVGYRIDFTNDSEKKLLTLKLGYSHYYYVKVPNNLALNCFTKTKFSIFGNSYYDISKLSSQIREKKIPEPYKGKGILRENDVVHIKEGKKI